MTNSRLFNWVFYGHVWIALGATALSWLTLRLVYEDQPYTSEWPVLTFIFFATLGVYTLHRYLSFQRAGVRPTSLRYEIVSKHPKASLIIGIASMIIAGGIGLTFIDAIWRSLLWALPLTIFYLTPPLPGWRRLRDLPYLKNIWVAWAWTIMTVTIPVWVISHGIEQHFVENPSDIGFCFGDPWTPYLHRYETLIRFAFTLTVALLFDIRDVVLDRSQNVKTIANKHPTVHRVLVAFSLFFSAWFTLKYRPYHFESDLAAIGIAITYLFMLPIAYLTYRKHDENWYAVVVNGLLLLPPFAYWLLMILGGDAGAGGGLLQ